MLHISEHGVWSHVTGERLANRSMTRRKWIIRYLSIWLAALQLRITRLCLYNIT